MNLKEEIAFELDRIGISPFPEFVEPLNELFKKWALEMVGEDDTEYIKPTYISDYAEGKQEGFNNAKEEIRQRIEEATK